MIRGAAAKALLLGLGSALLAACGGDDGPPPPCPALVRPPEAARLVDYVGGGRDLTDVSFEATIGQAFLTCEYDEDLVEAELDVTFIASEGPANAARSAVIRYFVAIATRDQEILTREQFAVQVAFAGNLTRLAVTEQLSPRIPLAPGQSGANFVVYVGFVLSPEQLEANRRNL